jgi:vacuolar protein sorting-associated protein 45
MLNMEVYLFERLDLIHQRPPLNFVKCIVFVRPTESNLQMLQRELRNPKFANYYMYFSNHASKAQVERLAQSDDYETVRCLKESFADFLAVNPHLFSFNLKSSCYDNSKNRWASASLHRCAQGLLALLLAVRAKPAIRYQASSLMCKELSGQIKLSLSTESMFSSNPIDSSSIDVPPVLLILDRKSDPITPMLNQVSRRFVDAH